MKGNNTDEENLKKSHESVGQIKELLKKGEVIKWYRRKQVNLLIFLRNTVLFIVISFLVGIVFFVIIDPSMLALMIITFIIIDIILISKALRKSRKMRLNLTHSELKDYNEIVMITNMRYIFKNYYYLNHQISNLFDDGVVTQINDIVLLDLKFVDYTIINNIFKKIYIWVGYFGGAPDFEIYFFHDKENDINSVFNILKDLIPLELIESTKSAEKYRRIGKPNI